jgi:hypothetical protein
VLAETTGILAMRCFVQVAVLLSLLTVRKLPGYDLAKMLWLKSKNSELWVERRLNYTKSLAVMSMVGYILGLGDRCLLMNLFQFKILITELAQAPLQPHVAP